MRKWEDRLKKVEHLAQSFQKNPLTSGYKPRLWPCQPASVWRLFPRQSMAIHFAQTCKEAVHVFALEKEMSSLGPRMYLVTSYSELWHYYKTYPQSLMHCYEVIPEGAVCKLYFDLEFHKPSNIRADGKRMVSLLIQYMCVKLKETYGIDCSAQNVLNLDSSTNDKFSRHLIFNLPNAAFKDNIHVGRFVHKSLEPIRNKGCIFSLSKNSLHEKDPVMFADKTSEEPQTKKHKCEGKDLSFLLVKNKDGEDCLFVDLGVYTKNRNFRLYKSSKVGKNAAFTVAEDNKFSPKTKKGNSVEQGIFLASLVCNISFTGQRILTFSEETEANETRSKRQGPTSMKASPLSGCMSSPHQELDQFVLTLVQKDGIQGAIRRWHYFAADQLLVYDIANFRWCENVGRFHKSNNILIVVDLKEEVWYQKCHDPDCKNFRSSNFTLESPISTELKVNDSCYLDNYPMMTLQGGTEHFELWRSSQPNNKPLLKHVRMKQNTTPGYPLPQEICTSYLLELDEEDQMYLMDDNGNIELSQEQAKPPPLPQTDREQPEKKSADTWDNTQDDQDFLESLDAFEQNKELPDELLLKCMDDYDSH